MSLVILVDCFCGVVDRLAGFGEAVESGVFGKLEGWKSSRFSLISATRLSIAATVASVAAFVFLNRIVASQAFFARATLVASAVLSTGSLLALRAHIFQEKGREAEEEAELAKLRTDLSAAQAALREKEGEKEGLQAFVNGLNDAADVRKQEIEGLKAVITKREAEVKDLKGSVERKKTRIKELTADNEALKKGAPSAGEVVPSAVEKAANLPAPKTEHPGLLSRIIHHREDKTAKGKEEVKNS